MPPSSANKAAHSGIETQRRHHQKSKIGLSVAPQKDLYSPKHLKQKGLFNNLVKIYPDILFQPNESWKWSDGSAVGMQLWGASLFS